MADIAIWENLTTEDFAGLDPDRSVAILPLGAVEQHGPHLPLATDNVIAVEMARLAGEAAETARPLLLPLISVGKSDEHLDYPGTLSLPAESLIGAWREIGAGVARAGVRKLLFLNAHGGQVPVIDIVIRDLRRAHGMLAVSSSFYRMGLPEGLLAPGEMAAEVHGGRIETSLMLHFRPDLVRMPRAKDFSPLSRHLVDTYDVLRLAGPSSLGWTAQDLHPDGAAGNAAAATAEIGARIVEHVRPRLGRLIDEIADFDLAALRTGPLSGAG